MADPAPSLSPRTYDARPRIDHHEILFAFRVESIDRDADGMGDGVAEHVFARGAWLGMEAAEVGRQHHAAIAFARLDPVEQGRGRRRDAAALQAIAELVQARHAAVEPALDLLDRAALA